MAGFDRSKYKPTIMADLKAQENEHETKRPSQGNSGKAGYLTIGKNENKFRFFPCHPDGGGKTYSEAKCVTFLSTEKPVYVDGKKTDKKELKRSPVFNSKVHGNTPIDLVEEYLRVAKNIAIPAFTDDIDRQDKIWKYLTGMNGIKPIDSWEVYASKFEEGTWSPIGILSLKKSITTQLKDIALEFVGNNPVSPDPFTDPNEGIAVIIKKTGEGLDTEYKATLSKIGVGKEAKFDEVPLTDEQLEAFDKLDPLHKLYVKSLKRSDFESQVEGLDNFEKELTTKKLKDKNGNEFTANIGVFQYEEFQVAMDQLLDLIPEAEAKEERDAPTDDEAEEHEEEVKEPIKIKPKATTVPKAEVKKASTPVTPRVEEKPAHVNAAPTMSLQERMAKLKAGLGK